MFSKHSIVVHQTNRDEMMKKPKVLILSLALTTMLFASFSGSAIASGGPYVNSSAGKVTIGNSFYELTFDGKNGALRSLVKKDTKLELITAKKKAWPVTWEIDLITQDKERLFANSYMTKGFYFWSEGNEEARTLHLIWNNLSLDEKGSYPMKVHVKITAFEDEPKSRWRVSGQNNGQATVTRFTIPDISGIRTLGSSGKNDHYFHPGVEGRLYNDMWNELRKDSARGVYPSAFANMQFTSLYDKVKGGFYLSTRDSKGYHKKFSLTHNDDFLVWKIEHYPVSTETDAFKIPYSIWLGPQEGGWQRAADIYKGWALKQPWAERKISDKSPEWLINTAASNQFMAHPDEAGRHHSFDEFAEVTLNHSNRLGKPMLGELWAWESGKLRNRRGGYFPPYEGWGPFEEAVRELNENGSRIRIFVYANRLSRAVEDWQSKEAKESALKTLEGGFVEENNEVRLDISTDFWKDKLKEFTLTLVKHGVSHVQLDGFPHMEPEECYDRDHSHPLGLKGNWTTIHWLDLLKEIDRRATEIDNDFVLGAESIAEPFLNYLDLYHMRESWQEVSPEGSGILEGYVDVVPAFSYVYHQNIIPLGHFNKYLSKRFNTRYHLLGLSRVLKWGKLPSYNFRDPLPSGDLNEKAFDYLKEIVSARQNYAKKYLVLGQMVKAPKIDSPNTNIPISFPRSNVDRTLKVPSIQYSAWKANDGTVGVIMTNISRKELEITVPLNKEEFPVTAQNSFYQIKVTVNGEDVKKVTDLGEQGKVLISLNPREIALVELSS